MSADGLGPAHRIFQVVPVVDSSNSFGGPLSVAVEQCTALRRKGFEAEILGCWLDAPAPPTAIEGVPCRLFRPLPITRFGGFAFVVSLQLVFFLARNRRRVRVVHLHCGRHLIGLFVAGLARLAHLHYVYQPHGMLPERTDMAARLFDWGLRPLLRSADAVFSLTPIEDGQIASFGVCATRLPNGVHLGERVDNEVTEKPRTVLYLSRIHPRKRPADLCVAAALVRGSGIEFQLRIVGSDDGGMSELQNVVHSLGNPPWVSLAPAVSRSTAKELLRAAAVLVLPSADEPFPMVVLEALSVGTPVIITRSCGIAETLEMYGAAGIVPVGEPQILAEELASVLTNEPLQNSRREAGLRCVAREFSIDVVADRLIRVYINTEG